jgi:hypothetical protein
MTWDALTGRPYCDAPHGAMRDAPRGVDVRHDVGLEGLWRVAAARKGGVLPLVLLLPQLPPLLLMLLLDLVVVRRAEGSFRISTRPRSELIITD